MPRASSLSFATSARKRLPNVSGSRVQPALRSIYLLELTLLTHRVRRDTGYTLAQQQDQELNHFLNEYSNELTHIAARIARQEEAPARITDDSIRLLKLSFEEQSSRIPQAIADICQKMVASLLYTAHRVLSRRGFGASRQGLEGLVTQSPGPERRRRGTLR